MDFPGLGVGPWLAFCAIIFAATTLWSGARRTAVDLLEKQVKSLVVDVARFRDHAEACEKQLDEMRRNNDWLTEQIREIKAERRRRGWFR